MALTVINGTDLQWTENCKLHRDTGPAHIAAQGNVFWAENNRLYRPNGGPSVVHADGCAFWFKQGVRHREDGPAIVYSNGSTEYWLNGNKLSDISLFVVSGKS